MIDEVYVNIRTPDKIGLDENYETILFILNINT